MNSESEFLSLTNTSETGRSVTQGTLHRPETKEIHVRVPITNYQYLDQLAIRYGIRSLSGAVNFLVEFHRQSQTSPTLGRALGAAKQAE